PSSEEQSGSEEQPSSTAAIGGESESNGNLAGGSTETISADGNGTGSGDEGSEDGIVHISPSTGGKIQIKAWAVVGTFLMGAFIFLRKRR
ncbi:MAG TPA: hypothetical protein DCY19_10060, partial [Eubacterium sp.]|nr:hypothetical protein [Eubacterium sp.]